MARLVKHTAKGPAEIKPGDESAWICRCGLTRDDKGRCDGSHGNVQTEDDAKTYSYESGKREEIKS